MNFRDKNKEDYNRIDQAEKDIWYDVMNHKKLFIGLAILSLMLSFLLVGLCIANLSTLFSGDSLTFGSFIKSTFGNVVSYPLALFMAYALLRVGYKFYKINEKNYVEVREDGENYKQAKETPYGDRHWQTEKERKACFDISKDFEDITNDIMGYDNNKRIYSMKFPPNTSKNRNKIVFGAAGSGKSASIVYNDLIQCFRRGESVIATDSKGDVYRSTAAIAKRYGYIVKTLNLKAKELKYSNAWEPLKYVTEEDEIQADVLANAIISNTQSGPMDYWADNEFNCLKAAILLVAISPEYEGHRSFAEVIDIVSDPTSFNDKFRGLPNDNPAKLAFNIYVACDPKVQGQILNGMAIRLALLTNKYVKEIVSHDEIDMILPMQKKCIYYIIISDTDTTMRFVASMFFTQIFMLQCDYSDSLSNKDKEKQLSVRYELDEFKNIGQIPYFDVKISTFRSRKISSTIILQGITQLMDLYPNKNHEVIMANTTTKILCKAGDMETAKYFEGLCGETTIVINNSRYSKGRSQMLDLHNAETISDGYGKRFLLPAAKAMALNDDILVVCILGESPIKLNKFITPLYNPIYKKYYEEKEPSKRLPKWRRDKMEAERAQKERIAEMNKKLKEKAVEEEDEFSTPADTGIEKQKKPKKTNSVPVDMEDIPDISLPDEDDENSISDDTDISIDGSGKTVRFDPETGEIFDDTEADNSKEDKDNNKDRQPAAKPSDNKDKSVASGTNAGNDTGKRRPLHMDDYKKDRDRELKINSSRFAPQSKGNSLLTDLVRKN